MHPSIPPAIRYPSIAQPISIHKPSKNASNQPGMQVMLAALVRSLGVMTCVQRAFLLQSTACGLLPCRAVVHFESDAVCLCACAHTYVCTCFMYTEIHIHIYIYIHLCLYLYINMHYILIQLRVCFVICFKIWARRVWGLWEKTYAPALTMTDNVKFVDGFGPKPPNL